MKTMLSRVVSITIALCAVQPLYADNGLAESLSELGNDLQATGKAALNAVSDTLHAAGDALSKTARAFSAKACLGSWVFVNGKCTTTLICNDDGSAELRQTRGKRSTSWLGTFTSTASAITFQVAAKASKGAFFSSNDPLNETWLISYKVSGDTMRLSSGDLPCDANGYDFSNPTLLVQQAED